VVAVSVGGESLGLEPVDNILNASVGFGDGPGIEDDEEYIIGASVPSNYTAMNLFPGNVARSNPLSVNVYFQIFGASGREDYEGLTAGAVDIWLLQSVLPA
jgi:hypothetical protein